MVTNAEDPTQKMSNCKRLFSLIIHCAVVKPNYSRGNEVLFLPTKHGGLFISLAPSMTVANPSENIIKSG